jgi:molybdopterin converting factor small subunit
MTQVELKFTGEVWARMKAYHMNFSFEGRNVGDLLTALFKQYELRDLVLDENDRIIPWSRIIVNGRFSEFIGDLSAPVKTGDEVVLVRPFLMV